MNDAPALLLAGVGLSFLGLELVLNALQESTSRTVRSLIRRSTRSPSACALIGLLAGALLQSTSAVATVAGGTASAGMTTLRQALLVVSFANVGTTALVFAGAVNIRIVILLAVGLSGIAFALAREFHRKAAAAVALGVALLLYGSDLMGSAAAGIQGAGWFATFLRAWHESAVMSFALGCLASFLTQSTTAIALMTVALANAGLVSGASALPMIYGANLGSTLMRMVLTRRSTGVPRQVSRFQDLFKTAGVAAFVLLLAVEQLLDVPGVGTAIRTLPVGLPVALATVNLALNASTALVALMFIRPLERMVLARWPHDPHDDFGVPVYAVPEAIADAATATDLLEKEQLRMLTATRQYLTTVRRGAASQPRTGAADLHRKFTRLFHDIEHFQVALVSKQLDEPTSARLANLQGRQRLLEMLENSLHQMAASVNGRPGGGTLEPFIETMIDGTDFLLLYACDPATAAERERVQLLFRLSGDRNEMMAEARNTYLSGDRPLTAAERALLVRLTVLFERIVWMVHSYAELILRSMGAPPPAGSPEPV